MPPLFNDREVLSSTPNEAKLLRKSKNSIYLPVFLPRTNLKLHNHSISVAPKMVKKVKMYLDSSEASGPDCIPVVFLKNCESEV